MLDLQLISLYYRICHYYSTQLGWQVQRFSPNSLEGSITDEEILTIYLFCVAYEEKAKVKSIHSCIRHHWLSYFPALPSYQTFVSRLNRLSACLPLLIECLLSDLAGPEQQALEVHLLDSLPIITCSHKRAGKVARELTDKGYCATKGIHYHGVKVHVIGRRRAGTLPEPELIGLSPASVHDLAAMRPVFMGSRGKVYIGDKAYADAALDRQLAQRQDCALLTPIKKTKNMPLALQAFDRAYNDLFSSAVSSLRQPIEALFSWWDEKTQLQNASKVRSAKGLLVHVFGKIAAAILLWSNL